jgi:ATP-dependent Clp protease ATP-binding subunit ClpX
MVGPSGSGKTLTIKTIAKMFNLPFIIADATSLTEAGYVGEDVENLIKRLIQSADDDLEKAKHGIIFIDEIDKKSKKNESSTVSRDISGEGVQQSLLKLIEGTVVKVEDEYGETVDFDTKDILFICSGAFVGLDEIIRKNRNKTSIGINATLNNKVSFSQTVKSATPEDFIKFGLIPEFVGRCPVVVVFDDLTPDMILRVLKEPKNSIVSQFKALFKYEGVSLDFDDKYLLNVADECLKQKIGARGLRSILEKHLQETQFVLPRLAKEGVNKIFVDANGTIKHVYKAKKRAANE